MRRRPSSRKYYDSIHYSPGAIRGSFSAKLAVSDPWYQLVLELLNRKAVPGGQVLEVGCGLGGFCQRLASGGNTVTGVDFSVSALSAARRHVEDSEDSWHVRFVAGDAKRLPFSADSFDLVVCAETLEHTSDVAACVNDLFRVCNPGGYVVMTIPNATMAVPFGMIAHAVRADQPQILLTYFRLRKLAAEAGFIMVDEDGTNFFRDMILNDVLQPSWRDWASRISRALDRWVPRGTHLWKVTAGTIGILVEVPQRK